MSPESDVLLGSLSWLVLKLGACEVGGRVGRLEGAGGGGGGGGGLVGGGLVGGGLVGGGRVGGGRVGGGRVG